MVLDYRLDPADDLYKELTTKLRDALYSDIASLFTEYAEKFFVRT